MKFRLIGALIILQFLMLPSVDAQEPTVRLNRNAKSSAPKRPTKLPSKVQVSKPESTVAAGTRIGKITVKGNKKIELDAVLAKLASREGQPYSAVAVRQDVEALFKTGYFYDVVVSRESADGSVHLIYNLVEKPSIVELIFEGNSEIEVDELKEAAGIKAYEILSNSKIREAVTKMQKQYEDKGYFLAKITPVVDTVKEGESVKLTFKIEENDKVKVKRMTILGNRHLGDGFLRDRLQTKEGGFFSFVSGSGSYKQDIFDRDVAALQYIYFNEGYVQVKVDRPQVYVTPDKKGIYITIRVEEGERFKVGTVDFAGDLLFDKDDLFGSVDVDGSGWYVHETLLKDIRTLEAKYGDLGYAYTNVIPRTQIREKDREIDITFEIDKGNKVYFGRINVVGNNKTRDKVVRRELRVREGELYHETRKRESIDNIKRLGFFDEVNFNASTPPDNQDVMNIDIVVKERSTGILTVGAGYSTLSAFIFNTQVKQENLMGRGQKLGVDINLSRDAKRVVLNFTEPYLYDSEWSLGFDAVYSQQDQEVYNDERKKGAVHLGHPLAPYTRGIVSYIIEDTLITNVEDTDLYPPEQANGTKSAAAFTLEYDKRDDRWSPSKGLFGSAYIEYAGLGGRKQFTRSELTAKFFSKIAWQLVWRNNLSYGVLRPNNGGEPPFNELYRLGGPNTLRGFYAVGRRKRSTKIYNDLVARGFQPIEAEQRAWVVYGGSQQLYYNSELEFPLISEANIKGVLFYDVGAAEDELSKSDFRSDVGFGFRWFSPIGPLRFEWAFPIARRPEYDEPGVNFQFAIGSPF